MNRNEESDPTVLASKPTNKAGRPVAEPVQRRVGTKGNASQHNTRRAQNRESVTQALDRVRQAARTRKKERFTAHIARQAGWLVSDSKDGRSLRVGKMA